MNEESKKQRNSKRIAYKYYCFSEYAEAYAC